MKSKKLGRAYASKDNKRGLDAESIASVFPGKFEGTYDLSFTRKSEKTGKWERLTHLKFADDYVLDARGRFFKLAFEDGVALVYEDSEPEAPFSPQDEGDDSDVPF